MISNYNRLSGLQKVAILFSVLGESLALNLVNDLDKTEIRKIRAELSIHPKEIINVKIYINESNLVKDITQHSDLIDNMTNIKIEITDQKDENIDYIDLIDEKYISMLDVCQHPC